MIARRRDWATRLIAFVESRQHEPFAWGTNDCTLFAADAVRAMTDVDLALGYRGRYRSAKGALKALRAAGAETLTDFVDSVLPPIAPALARRGDAVAFIARDGEALGICLGLEAAAMGPDGVVLIPAAQWVRAWRV